MTSLPAIAALRGAGIETPILGGDGLDIGAAWKQVAQADNIYFTTHAYLGADNPDPRVKAFRAAFAKAYPGKEADAFAALGYDTARLLMAAIKSAGSTKPQAVRKALAATHDFAGVTGTISYRGGSRIPAKSVSIIAVKQGRQSSRRQRAAAENPAALTPLLLEIRLDRTLDLHGQRVAVAILGVADHHADPALADAIFFDVGALLALEADADIARERFGIVIGTDRVVAEPVGRCVGWVAHGRCS